MGLIPGISALFGPQSPASILTTFIECLVVVIALDVFGRGRRVYLAVVIGVGLALYAQIANGVIDATLDSLLRAAGLVLAAVVLVFDLVFEAADTA